MRLALILSWLFTNPALAAGARVLVSPFQAEDAAAASLAALLDQQVLAGLDAHPELEPVDIEQVAPVHDQAARLYAESCPPGQHVGCAFVLGQAGNADYAVAGVVSQRGSVSLVELHILDVVGAEDVLAFEVRMGQTDESALASAVARVLISVVRGEAGRSGDIRRAAPSTDQSSENESHRRTLDQLHQEIGDASSVEQREVGRVERERLSLEDLTEKMQAEGSKPWERLGMKPKEYLRYYNSGHSLVDWRQRAAGRRGQVILRPFAGYGRGPVDERYQGAYARVYVDGVGYVTQEVDAWQTFVTDTGVTAGGTVSYGILPILEVGLTAGSAFGRYQMRVDKANEAGLTTRGPEEEYGNTNLFFGPEVLASLLPTSALRPVVGGRFVYWRGTGVEGHRPPPDELPAFKAPSLLLVTAIAGLEARVARHLDVFLHVPVSAAIGGSASASQHQGGGYLTDLETSPALAATSAALVLGFQVRLLGRVGGPKGLDAYQD